MSEDEPTPEPVPPPPGRWVRLWAGVRVALVMSVFGPSYLIAAAVALVWFGAMTAWRDMRTWTGNDHAVD